MKLPEVWNLAAVSSRLLVDAMDRMDATVATGPGDDDLDHDFRMAERELGFMEAAAIDYHDAASDLVEEATWFCDDDPLDNVGAAIDGLGIEEVLASVKRGLPDPGRMPSDVLAAAFDLIDSKKWTAVRNAALAFLELDATAARL